MYAIVKTGGKQIKVSAGDKLRVERLAGEAGDKVTLTDVLLIGNGDKITVGTPLIKDAAVEATIIEQKRDRKILVFKKKRRHNYRRRAGHRQHLTVLEILAISTDGKKETAAAAPKAAAAATPAAKKETAAKPAAKKPAAKKPAAKK